MIFNINKYDFFIFTIVFIIFTVIGTISHEFGHIAVAKHLGYKTSFHYGSMTWNRGNGWDEMKNISLKYKYEIENSLDFQEKEKYEMLVEELNKDRMPIVLGGPSQTILTGSVGFIFLLFHRKSMRMKIFNKLDWVFVFLSLFWLREVFNPVMSISSTLINKNTNYFGGDEAVISSNLGLPTAAIPVLLGITGLIIIYGYILLALIFYPNQNKNLHAFNLIENKN